MLYGLGDYTSNQRENIPSRLFALYVYKGERIVCITWVLDVKKDHCSKGIVLYIVKNVAT